MTSRAAVVLVLCLAVFGTGAPVASATVYTLSPEARRVATSPDGAIVVVSSRGVERIERGRTSLLAGGSERLNFADVAVTPDGGVFVVDAAGCRVLRVARGRLVAVAGGRRCSFGAGSDRLCRPRALDALPTGELLLADECRGLLRVRPGGGLEPVGEWPVDPPERIAVLADGSIVAAGGGALWRLVAGRPAEPLLDWQPAALAAVDEGLLLVHPSTGRLMILDTARQLREVPTRRPDGRWDGDGDPLPRGADIGDMARAPDGGWLIAFHSYGFEPFIRGGLRYVPPLAPGVLAVAIRRETLPAAQPLRVALSLTRSAAVTVEVLARGRVRAVRRLHLAAGEPAVRIGGLTRHDVNVVRVRARSAGAFAEDRVSVLTAAWLPMRIAAWLAYEQVTVPRFYGWQVEGRAGCRRLGARRIDCAQLDQGWCDALLSIRLRRDGRLAVGRYDFANATGEQCRFSRRARLRDQYVQVVPEVPE
jgi:hypothetical protein